MLTAHSKSSEPIVDMSKVEMEQDAEVTIT